VNFTIKIQADSANIQKINKYQIGLDSLRANPLMQGATIAFEIKDYNTGEIVFEYSAHRKMTSASVMKVVTTSSALKLLRDTAHFRTQIAYDGNIDSLGVLHGNIYIIGGGDPTLGSRFVYSNQTAFMSEWLKAIRSAGIQRVAGRVISDASIFGVEGVSRKLVLEDIGNYYAAGTYGLNVFDNEYKLVLSSKEPGSIPKITRTEPDIEGLKFHNYLQTVTAKKDSVYINGMPFENVRWLRGVVPAYAVDLKLRGDIPDPPLFLAQFLTTYLRSSGITIDSSATTIRIMIEQSNMLALPCTKKKIIYTTISPSIASLVKSTNYFSINQYADLLCKKIGLLDTRDKYKNSADRGVSVMKNYWSGIGVDMSGLDMYDGSGLSATSKITADILCDILYRMKDDKAFVSSLPVAGETGTLTSFLDKTSLKGRLRAKSGSMSGVKCYAGYVTSPKNGHRYIFSVLVNGQSCHGKDIMRLLETYFIKIF